MRIAELPPCVVQRVDLSAKGEHTCIMNFDISHLLEHWEYRPGAVLVRKFIGKDGSEKIQLRVDLGLLQMNAQGRPDGKRPMGHASLLEFYGSRLEQHIKKNDGSDEEFALSAEDCAKLQVEALQYHHRCICLLQLEDYAGVIEDTERNLNVFDFVEGYAESDELGWMLQQFRPQVLMLQARASALQELHTGNYVASAEAIESGLDKLKDFYEGHSRHDLLEQSMEIQSLKLLLEEVISKRPLSRRERLELDLNEAVKREDYEKAAEVRDALRNLKPSDAE